MLALQEAIDKAVYGLVLEGVDLKLWQFADASAGAPFLERYHQERDGLLSPQQVLAAERLQHSKFACVPAASAPEVPASPSPAAMSQPQPGARPAPHPLGMEEAPASGQLALADGPPQSIEEIISRTDSSPQYPRGEATTLSSQPSR
jgi:hypothetical protein